MGLYLCVFEKDEELEGVEVGSYSDFEFFRSSVTNYLEGGVVGNKFPILLSHPDSDGEWTADDCQRLKEELSEIADRFKQFPPIPFGAEWQQQVSDFFGLNLSSLYDSFIDVDGEPLLERLIQLCNVATEHDCPIIFQ
ncbi:MAG: hypothetical protein COA78_01500 [Blastopirellula sp.]|nr:MAG: hypothetical protein COA78_01500 [Blastopirellula sp.]